MTLLAPHKLIERDLADMKRMGICSQLPVFCCRNDPTRTCILKGTKRG